MNQILKKIDKEILEKQNAFDSFENAIIQMNMAKKALLSASLALTKEIYSKITEQDLIGKMYVCGSYSIDKIPSIVQENNQFFINGKINTYYDYAECVDNHTMRKIVNFYTNNFEFQHEFFNADNYLLLASIEEDHHNDGNLRKNFYKFNFIAI